MSRTVPEPRPRRPIQAPATADALSGEPADAAQPQTGNGDQAPQRAKTYELGILFIHGMGQQARGDTITEMGDALTEWLRRWLGNDKFRLQHATLRSREDVAAATTSPGTSDRAHAEIVLGRRTDPEGSGQRWLLAESWWADVFRPATFGEVAAWAIGVGPWLIASQLAGLRERLEPTNRGLSSVLAAAAGAFVFIALFVAAALVAALIAPLVLMLLLLSLVPVPVVGGIAQALARNLAGSFGDLLIFVRSPVRFAAMTERVREDIAWLAGESERIMVVAHSQGSAVAWQAIRRTAQADEDIADPIDRTPLALFLTFGQAFRKLKALHRLHTRVGGGRQFTFAVLAILSTICLLVAGISGYFAFGTLIAVEGDSAELVDRAWLALVLPVLLLGFVGVLQWWLSTLAANNDAKAEKLILGDLAEVRAVFPGLRWLDLWSSADPAPNGPLFSKAVDGVESYRVRNLASTAFDHSVYWSNITEFVSAIVFAAGSLATSSPLGPNAVPPRLKQAARIRDLRVTWLAGARVALFAALGSALIGFWSDLPELGDLVIGLLGWVPFVPEDAASWPAFVRGVIGALLLSAAAGAVWWLLCAAWAVVVRTDESSFFGRQRQESWSPWFWLWVVGAALLPTAAAIALSQLRDDIAFVAWYVALVALGVLVVVRLMRTSEARLSD